MATLALLVCAGSARADISRHRRAAQLLMQWRWGDARQIIDDLVESSPRRRETRYLRAEMAFLEGEYQKALDALGDLPDGAMGGDVGSLRELIRGTVETTRGFKKQLSPRGHFEIAYQPGKDEVLVELAGDALDRAYEVFAIDFGFRPPTPIRVEILTRPVDLAKVSTLTEDNIRTTNTIALCKYNKLMSVTPRATLYGYAWLDTLAHEYVHYVVSLASHDRVPVWLHEGIARFQQNRWRGGELGQLSGTDEHLLASALKSGDFISFDAMHPSMAKLPSQEAAALGYAEVFTLVRYFHDKAGYPGLRKLLERIRAGSDAREAMVGSLGERRWRAVESGWKRHLQASKLRINPAVAGRARTGGIRFDKGGTDSENVGLAELDSERARSYARLGGILRARGKLRAAAMEYEKALSLTGTGNPLVSGKLARTYLSLERYQRAIELVEPLLSVDDNDPAPATTLGLAYSATGASKKAAEAFEQALRVNPFDPSVRCGLADAYADLDDPRQKRERAACGRLRGAP